ncbi:ABC transporter substrate-binding protein [Flavobacterium sp. ARAG 55.4]|uniref:ABC transporter substrate-binding protein n=1 Tax=Flavobacterium sp. ARAG 55.4 TaxID=3451357 RepID=UPI003F44A0DA
MSTKTIQLKGITWNHSRGFTSMVATAQRFSELNPGVEITWEKRSLQAFADEPIDKLAERYDLLVIDHPWAGFAGKTNVILPLDNYLSKEFLADLAENTVGHSHVSYTSNGHQYALAIDAATPVASSRPDIFAEKGLVIPKNYDELLALAKKGLVIMPGIPQDTLMNFYMMCCNLGEDVCTSKEHVVSEEIGVEALKMLRALAVEMDPAIFHWNPIKVYEAMTLTDKYAYCPWAYGYSNYSRNGYARKLLHFHDMIEINGVGAISTLGGTGLAVSAKATELDVIMKYVEYVASEDIQKTVFFDGGGQPGHRKAWTDEYTNGQTADYFKNTLPGLDRAFLRPRYNGHMYFQDRAGAPVRNYLMNGGDEAALLKQLNELYIKSLEV